jgi:hypothetical protein
LSSNNISSLPVNAFVSPSTTTTTSTFIVYLNNNQITNISPGSFQGIRCMIVLIRFQIFYI